MEYRKGFEDELKAFKERIQRRAKEKIEAAVTEAEEEERKNRLGPGGLDPVEVFESLPQVRLFDLQNVFSGLLIIVIRCLKNVLRHKTLNFFSKQFQLYQKKRHVIT